MQLTAASIGQLAHLSFNALTMRSRKKEFETLVEMMSDSQAKHLRIKIPHWRKMKDQKLMYLILAFLNPVEQLRAQTVCRDWYDGKIPPLMEPLDITQSKLVDLLHKVPITAKDETLAVWHNMRQVSADMLMYFWTHVEKSEPLWPQNSMFSVSPGVWNDSLPLSMGIDIDKEWEPPVFSFQRWETSDCEGFRHKETGEPHGFVKWVGERGHLIMEGTYKNGHKHGLHRFVQDTNIFLELFDNGTRLGYFWCDKYFREIVRADPSGHLQIRTENGLQDFGPN